jgi:hypothetical protein
MSGIGGKNLPPVSKTPPVPLVGAVDTDGKFATDVNVTDRNFERRGLNQRSKPKIPCTMNTCITNKSKNKL